MPTIVQVAAADPRDPPVEVSLWVLAGQIDRTVLLGDPGGGRQQPRTPCWRTAPLVPGARCRSWSPSGVRLAGPAGPLGRGIHRAPAAGLLPVPGRAGLVDQLLLPDMPWLSLTGSTSCLMPRAVPRSRRSWREFFCAEYPLARVLVTSRIVGYSQARLDHQQFSVYRLGSLSDDQVGEYVHKWFSQEEALWRTKPGAGRCVPGRERHGGGLACDAADAVPDVHPLSGEGSLPRNRARVYEQCATLLHRRWDARRRIHRVTPGRPPGGAVAASPGLVDAYLDDAHAAVTERELVVEATGFLHGRGFQGARGPPGRGDGVHKLLPWMVVFSEMGVHRQAVVPVRVHPPDFLEYFAAEYLADPCIPQQLVDVIASATWAIVSGARW